MDLTLPLKELNLKKEAKFRLDIRKNILTVMSEKMLEGVMKSIWEVSILRKPQNKKKIIISVPVGVYGFSV